MLLKIRTTLFILLLGHLTFAQQSAKDINPDSQIIQLANEFSADYGSLSRFYAIKNSPERRNRFRQFYNDYLEKLDQFSFDEFSTSGQVDYLLIKRRLNNGLHGLGVEEEEYEKTHAWIKHGESLYALEKKRRRGIQLDWAKIASQLDEISKKISQASTEIENDKPTFPRNLTSRAEGIIKGQQQALKSVYDFYNGYDPEFSWWITQPYQLVDSMLTDYSNLLQSCVDQSTLPKDDGSGIIGNPIGRNEVIRQLQSEMIPYSPEQLVEIALKEFAWCEVELLKASNEMGFGNDWKAAQEKVKQAYVPVGQQPEAMYELYNQSVDFLKSNNLISIPPLAEETWRMKMLSPERQLIAPFFLGGELLQIAYPTDDMEHEDKLMSLRGNNPHFARAVVHHELIAGHHLQQFMNRRHNTHRFSYTSFWSEGWALYWEMILWDEGFARSPEDEIGMLFWRMHRCARIIFSLNYHLEEWTPQQCIDYLVDRVGHEWSTAEGEVRRSFTGGYGPLYQIAYMIGGLQFYELKRELVDSGQMTYQEYHDAVMHENSMPVEMVRALLINQPLTKDFESSWKFYEE